MQSISNFTTTYIILYTNSIYTFNRLYRSIKILLVKFSIYYFINSAHKIYLFANTIKIIKLQIIQIFNIKITRRYLNFIYLLSTFERLKFNWNPALETFIIYDCIKYQKFKFHKLENINRKGTHWLHKLVNCKIRSTPELYYFSCACS